MPRKVLEFKDVPQFKLKKLSEREAASILASMRRNLAKFVRELEKKEKRQETERWKPKKESIGTCFCKGKIILSTSYSSEFNPMSGPLIIGPGSRGQFSRVEHQECFCESCGALYKPEIVKKRQG